MKTFKEYWSKYLGASVPMNFATKAMLSSHAKAIEEQQKQIDFIMENTNKPVMRVIDGKNYLLRK